MESQNTPNSQSNHEEKKKRVAGGIRLPDFRLCYKPTVIKPVWFWQKKNAQI